MPSPDFSDYDELHVVSNDLTSAPGFTLTSVVRNEMYFLPRFLDHYRKLGVERFIFLDDRSTDGTREYLGEQPDCMVLGSEKTFGDVISGGPLLAARLDENTAKIVWTNILVQKFCLGRWSLHVDADEWLRLPDGMRIPDFLPIADATGADAIWSVLLDLYPSSISRLAAMNGDATLNPDGEWYYDALPHMDIRKSGFPKVLYAGSRARLMREHHVSRFPYTLRQKLALKPLRHRLRHGYAPYNCTYKAPLIRMPEDGYLSNPHRPSFPGATGIVLPLEHFKFTPQIHDRVASATRFKQYFNRSSEYFDMQRLLESMQRSNGTFLCRDSSAARSFDDFRRAGIAVFA